MSFAPRTQIEGIAARAAAPLRDVAKEGGVPRSARRLRPSQVPAETAGAAVRRAAADPGHSLEPGRRRSLEQRLGEPLDAVRIHTGAAAHNAASLLGARAYTIGADIHLGHDAARLAPTEREALLAHEATHALQQGARRVPLPDVLPVGSPSDALETAALRSASPALAVRNGLRSSRAAPLQVQRDITGTSTKAELPLGTMKIAFKREDSAAKGGTARENGKITFTADAAAPESTELHFIQIVRTFDPSTGKDFDFTGTGEAPRNKMMTKADKAGTITPGFYVDQIAAALAQRTKKTDPTVLPYVDAMRTVPQQVGKHTKAADKDAILNDAPGVNAPLQFKLVSSVKAGDTGTWYGTVLWGFEVFTDAKGFNRIKGEYHQFRAARGATTDAAINEFNEYYKNPGASTAPK